jgi:hypothetical protein
MKLKLGADPKRMAVLGGLLVVLAYLVYDNFKSDIPQRSDPRPAVRTPAATLPPSGVASPEAGPPVTTRTPPVISRTPPRPAGSRSRTRGGVQEFKPRIGPQRPEDRLDPASIDPTLRLDLIAKLQTVKLEGGHRSLFEFSQPPAPKTEDSPKVIPKPIGPKPPEPTESAKAEPPKPPPPPINLKFYGYINSPRQNNRRAFFLDGEDILVAGEGDLLKKRYKIVRIGVNSAVVEDIDHKHQQTLPLIEQPQT